MTSDDTYLRLAKDQDLQATARLLDAPDRPFIKGKLESALIRAISKQDISVLKPLLSRGVRISGSAFLQAAVTESLGIYQQLIEHEWDINSIDPKTGETSLTCASLPGVLNLVRWFLDHGADPNLARFADGISPARWPRRPGPGSPGGIPGYKPLETAVFEHNWEAAKLLLSCRAEVGDRALFSCIDSQIKDEVTRLQYLLDQRGKVNALQ